MRKRMTIPVALLCLICFVILWHWRREKTGNNEEPTTVLTDTQGVPLAAERTIRQASPTVPPGQDSSPDPRRMDSNAFYQWWMTEGYVPIEFYGKVIDE